MHALAELEPDNSAWGECERKATALADASLYDTLGLTSEHADAAEVRRAYHAKSKQWHPDRHQATAEASRRANTAFQRITAAYETLSDANKRADYDLQLKLKGLRRRPSSSSTRGRTRRRRRRCSPSTTLVLRASASELAHARAAALEEAESPNGGLVRAARTAARGDRGCLAIEATS